MKTKYMEYVSVLQYSKVFGKTIPEEELDNKIKNLDCTKTILIISRLMSLFYKSQIKDKDAQKLYCELCVMYRFRVKGTYNLLEKPICPQSLLILAKEVILKSEVNDPVSEITVEDFMKIFDILLMINDTLPKGENEDQLEELIYLMVYHNTRSSILARTARSYYIYSKIMKRIPETKEFLDKFEEQKGYPAEHRIAVLFNCLQIVFPDCRSWKSFLGNMILARNYDSKGFPKEVYEKIISDLSIKIEDLKTPISETKDRNWDFEPLYMRPLIEIPEGLVILSPELISYNLWEGLYWDFRFLYAKSEKAFFREFGRAFEKYVQEITSRIEHKNILFINEFTYHLGKKEFRSSDAYILKDKTLFIIEAKAKSPHSMTFKSIAKDKVDEEISDLIIKPVLQVGERLDEILSGKAEIETDLYNKFSGITSVYVLVVSMEKVQMIGSIVSRAEIQIKENQINTLIKGFFNINIEEYEVLCHLFSSGENVTELLQGWFQEIKGNPKMVIPFSNLCAEKGIKYVQLKYVSGLFDEATNEMRSLFAGE